MFGKLGKYVVNSILVDVLNRLRKNFIRPITTICESEKKIIFMNIKELGDIHTAFFTALFSFVKENKGVGDVFIKFKEKFLKYADYCSGLTKAQITLENLCAENKEVEKEVNMYALILWVHINATTVGVAHFTTISGHFLATT